MSELFSIQLQNRQQQGRDGVWLDLPTTTEQVQAALRQIGISSDNPQGLFISGYFAEEEKRFAIPYNMVLASNVDELNFLASRLETLSTGERAELNAALQAPQSELFSIGKSAFRPIIRRTFSFLAILPRKRSVLPSPTTWCWHPMWTS